MTRVISGTTSVTMIAEADVGLACTKYSLSWLSFNVYTLKSFKTFKCSSIGRQKDLAQMLRGIHFIYGAPLVRPALTRAILLCKHVYKVVFMVLKQAPTHLALT